MQSLQKIRKGDGIIEKDACMHKHLLMHLHGRTVAVIKAGCSICTFLTAEWHSLYLCWIIHDSPTFTNRLMANVQRYCTLFLEKCCTILYAPWIIKHLSLGKCISVLCAAKAKLQCIAIKGPNKPQEKDTPTHTQKNMSKCLEEDLDKTGCSMQMFVMLHQV